MRLVNLFKNVGSTIKTLARILMGIGTAIAAILSLYSFMMCVGYAFEAGDGGFILAALLAPPIILVVVFVITWLAAIMIYSYGEIVDKLCEIERNTAKTENQKQEQEKAEKQKAETERLERERKAREIEIEKEIEEQRVEREREREREEQCVKRERLIEEMRRNEELAQQRRNEERERQIKNALEIKINSHCEGLCPKCGNSVTFERNFGYDKCKHCNTMLKITK